MYNGLNELNKRGVGFITVRRRGPSMLRRIDALPASAWSSCRIIQVGTRPRRVSYVDENVKLPNYEGFVRQLAITGLSHEKPTLLLTNDLPRRLPARQVIMDYAGRNRVEHNLGEKITFFHMDCLASEVRLNVDFDLTLTVAGRLLYQALARRLKGFETATPQKLYRKFVNTPGRVEIGDGELRVRFASASRPLRETFPQPHPRGSRPGAPHPTHPLAPQPPPAHDLPLNN